MKTQLEDTLPITEIDHGETAEIVRWTITDDRDNAKFKWVAIIAELPTKVLFRCKIRLLEQSSDFIEMKKCCERRGTVEVQDVDGFKTVVPKKLNV